MARPGPETGETRCMGVEIHHGRHSSITSEVGPLTRCGKNVAKPGAVFCNSCANHARRNVLLWQILPADWEVASSALWRALAGEEVPLKVLNCPQRSGRGPRAGDPKLNSESASWARFLPVPSVYDSLEWADQETLDRYVDRRMQSMLRREAEVRISTGEAHNLDNAGVDPVAGLRTLSGEVVTDRDDLTRSVRAVDHAVEARWAEHVSDAVAAPVRGGAGGKVRAPRAPRKARKPR